MKYASTRNSAAVAALLLSASVISAPAQARDFFSNFVNAITRNIAHTNDANPSASYTAMPFAAEGDQNEQQPPQQQQPRFSQSSSAYCVRTCDGRYFPISSTGDRAKTCNSLCPSSETKIVYGAGIDHAYTDRGQAYSALPNAFRYRNETVAGCTCNGSTNGGLAKIDIKDDPTVRRGDQVANADGKLTSAPKTIASAANYSPRPRVARQDFPFFPAFAGR